MLPQEAAAELDLRGYLQILRRRKTVIAISVLAIVALSLAASFAQPRRYAAVATLLLRPRSAGTVFASGASSQSNVSSERSVQTEIQVFKSAPVRDLVRREVGSAPPVKVAPVDQTDVVAIRSEGTEPQRVAAVANAYANAYAQFRLRQSVDELSAASEEVQSKITDLNRQLDNLGAQLATAPSCADSRTTPDACNQRTIIEQTVNSRRTTLLNQVGLFQQRLDQLQVDGALATGGAQLVTAAEAPTEPFEPTPVRNGALAGLLGLFVGVGFAFLREHLDDSIKGREDLHRAVPGVDVLALIPHISDWKSKEQSRVVSLSDPKSPAAEAYRILRTSIQFLGIDRQVRLIQVTSASAQEGKTTTLANLAVAFANSGMRTIAVCCDLRRPRLHDFFALNNTVGFTSVLLGKVSVVDALQPVPRQERLLLLASGPLPPNPAELLSSSRALTLFQTLAAQADIVLIDSPPVLPVTDSLVLSQLVDSTLLVGTAGLTTRKAAHRAAEMLHQVKAPLVGMVLNGTENDDMGYGNYASRYYVSDVGSGNGHEPSKGNGEAAMTNRRRLKRSS